MVGGIGKGAESSGSGILLDRPRLGLHFLVIFVGSGRGRVGGSGLVHFQDRHPLRKTVGNLGLRKLVRITRLSFEFGGFLHCSPVRVTNSRL